MEEQQEKPSTILSANPNRLNPVSLQFPKHQLVGMNRMASSLDSPRQILTRSQVLECVDAFHNDGILRRCISTLIMGIKGKRVKFVVEPNEEISELLDEEEKRQLNDAISKNDRVPELKRKQIRIDKRCNFNERLNTFLTSYFVTGRGLLGIVRMPKNEAGEFPLYGEPRALQPLNTIRISDIEVDPVTYELTGVEYDFEEQTTTKKKVIRPINMIFGAHNDNNLFDNTAYSGTSLIWPSLSSSQSNIVINDEDIPEATRAVAHKFGLINTGTQNQAVTAQIRDQLEQGTWLVHNQQGLTADVYDMARDLTELPRVRELTSKYMTWSTLVPLFLIFEDTANFATAAQAVQAWKVTVIDYYRTVLQGILEKYWYDPILADHYGIKVEDVISQRVKTKPIFEDLIFDTFKDTTDANVALVNAGILTEVQALKNMGFDKFVQEREELQAEVMRQREESIKQREEMIQQQQQQNNFNNNQQNNGNNNGDQNANPQFQKQNNFQRFNKNREAPK